MAYESPGLAIKVKGLLHGRRIKPPEHGLHVL
jgi:hypothetical protein